MKAGKLFDYKWGIALFFEFGTGLIWFCLLTGLNLVLSGFGRTRDGRITSWAKHSQ